MASKDKKGADRTRWLARLLELGLENHVFEAPDVVAYATPEVLSECLPPESMTLLLKETMARGAMTPDLIVSTLRPQGLAQYIPHNILWSCISGAAERAGLGTQGAKATDAKRKFVQGAMTAGLECAMLDPEDVSKHLSPEVLAFYLPTQLKAKLLHETLRLGKINPQIVLEVVGVDGLALHAPPGVIWACMTETAGRSLGSPIARGSTEPVVNGRPSMAADDDAFVEEESV
jgi:hypothetical protein